MCWLPRIWAGSYIKVFFISFAYPRTPLASLPSYISHHLQISFNLFLLFFCWPIFSLSVTLSFPFTYAGVGPLYTDESTCDHYRRPEISKSYFPDALIHEIAKSEVSPLAGVIDKSSGVQRLLGACTKTISGPLRIILGALLSPHLHPMKLIFS